MINDIRTLTPAEAAAMLADLPATTRITLFGLEPIAGTLPRHGDVVEFALMVEADADPSRGAVG